MHCLPHAELYWFQWTHTSVSFILLCVPSTFSRFLSNWCLAIVYRITHKYQIIKRRILFSSVPCYVSQFCHSWVRHGVLWAVTCIFLALPRLSIGPKWLSWGTVVQISQNTEHEYWVNHLHCSLIHSLCSFIRFAHALQCAHFFARSLILLTPKLVGKCII